MRAVQRPCSPASRLVTCDCRREREMAMRRDVVPLQPDDTDFEAAVEVSQSLRANMQREARLTYKFEASVGVLRCAWGSPVISQSIH